MEFQKERVFTALNADELKVGSKVIVANTIGNLKELVEQNMAELSDLTRIDNTYSDRRFVVNEDTDRINGFAFAYLVSVPEVKDWVVYLCRRKGVKPYLTCCRSDCWEEVQTMYGAKTKLFEGTEEETDDWYTARRQFADIIAAWEDGKTIQYNSGNGWEDCCDNKPAWDVTSDYRIKPNLKWTDLKIGDILREKNGTQTCMVTVIDTSNEPDGEGDVLHICLGDWWPTDKELEDWEKVEK